MLFEASVRGAGLLEEEEHGISAHRRKVREIVYVDLPMKEWYEAGVNICIRKNGPSRVYREW